jgi:hypothetical protein
MATSSSYPTSGEWRVTPIRYATLGALLSAVAWIPLVGLYRWGVFPAAAPVGLIAAGFVLGTAGVVLAQRAHAREGVPRPAGVVALTRVAAAVGGMAVALASVAVLVVVVPVGLGVW